MTKMLLLRPFESRRSLWKSARSWISALSWKSCLLRGYGLGPERISLYKRAARNMVEIMAIMTAKTRKGMRGLHERSAIFKESYAS